MCPIWSDASGKMADARLATDIETVIRVEVGDVETFGMSTGRRIDASTALLRDLAPHSEPELTRFIEASQLGLARGFAIDRRDGWRRLLPSSRGGRMTAPTADAMGVSTGVGLLVRAFVVDAPGQRPDPSIMDHRDSDRVLDAIFAAFVARRYGQGGNPHAIARSVRLLAGRYPTIDTSVVAQAAESLIRAALGESAVVDVSGWTKAHCQLFIIGEIESELGLYRDEIDAIIAEAEASI